MFVNEKQFRFFIKKRVAQKSVAIVGSSPLILNKGFGKLIDEHDIVIRFNEADVRGNEHNVGSKTNLRFVGCTLTERHAPFFQSFSEDSKIITKKKNQESLSHLPEEKLVFLDFNMASKAFRNIDRALGTEYAAQAPLPPRSGLVFLSYFLANNVEPEVVSIFGMEREARSGGQTHYYNNTTSYSQTLRMLPRYHADLEIELAAFNAVLDSFPEKIKFY